MNHFHCKLLFTNKCIDQANKKCDACYMNTCHNCENNWSSNTCQQCSAYNPKGAN